jgi:hypothetical protein
MPRCEASWSGFASCTFNNACDTLSEVVQAARQGVERVREAWWLPYSDDYPFLIALQLQR